MKGHARILKRLLIHVAGCNLALLMRTQFGLGTPRGLQGLTALVLRTLWAWTAHLRAFGKERTGIPPKLAAPTTMCPAA